AVKIYRVWPPMQSLYSVSVLLAVGHVQVLGLQAVEPAALIYSVEDAPGNQCLDPDGEIVRGGDDTPGKISKRGVQVRVVSGQERPGPCRGLDVGRVRRVRQDKQGTAVQVAVRVGIGDGVRTARREESVVHSQRPEQPVLHRPSQWFAIDLLGDE